MKFFPNEQSVKSACIEAAIFDLDGTLYPPKRIDEIFRDMKIGAVQYYLDMTRDEATEYLISNGVIDGSFRSLQSFTDFISYEDRIGLSAWNEYRDTHFSIDTIRQLSLQGECVTYSTLQALASTTPIYIVTNNSRLIAQRMLDAMDIPREVFNHIYASQDMIDEKGNKTSKLLIYDRIAKKHSCDMQDMIAIGDRYDKDLAPLIEVGGYGMLIEDPHEIEILLDILSNPQGG